MTETSSCSRNYDPVTGIRLTVFDGTVYGDTLEAFMIEEE
jgi:hypothetical protein